MTKIENFFVVTDTDCGSALTVVTPIFTISCRILRAFRPVLVVIFWQWAPHDAGFVCPSLCKSTAELRSLSKKSVDVQLGHLDNFIQKMDLMKEHNVAMCTAKERVLPTSSLFSAKTLYCSFTLIRILLPGFFVAFFKEL